MLTFIDKYEVITERHNANITVLGQEEHNFLKSDCSYFILLQDGQLSTDSGLSLTGLGTACINSGFRASGTGLVIQTPGYSMLEETVVSFNAGIPGNLSYIDGCSNSNLVHPARNGDPCTNYLYFPHEINQTFHTHPSYRIGIILSGQGFAEIRSETGTNVYELKPGVAFNLHRHSYHRFFTKDSHLSLMVFHPDSEDGPRDENNPMKTRTYIQR